jgi:hypothetical protein
LPLTRTAECKTLDGGVNQLDEIRRAGNAAIAGGTLVFLGQTGGIIFAEASRTIEAVAVSFFALAAIALGRAFWALRELPARIGFGGIRLALVGSFCLGLFGVQATVSVARTGAVPEAPALVAAGVACLLLGQGLLALDLRRRLIGAWPLLAAADVGLLLVLVDVGPIRDLGLIVFECAWVAFGLLLFRAAQQVGDVPVARASS